MTTFMWVKDKNDDERPFSVAGPGLSSNSAMFVNITLMSEEFFLTFAIIETNELITFSRKMC